MKKIVTISITYLLIISIGFALADDNYYDRCGDILVHGIADQYEMNQSLETYVALRNWLCWINSGSSSIDASASVDIWNIFIPISAGGGSHEEWYRENCSDESYQYDGSEMTHILIQKANPDIVNAWKECVLAQPESKGLVCYADESEDSIAVEIQSEYGIDDPAFSLINLNLLTTVPDPIYPGEFTVLAEKTNNSREGRFVLNGYVGHTSATCSFFIPPKSFISLEDCADYYYSQYTAGNSAIRDAIYDYYGFDLGTGLFGEVTEWANVILAIEELYCPVDRYPSY